MPGNRALRTLKTFGFDARAAYNSMRGLNGYLINRRLLEQQARGAQPAWEIGNAWPCPADRFDDGGVATGQYFHQDLYVAQQIFKARPDRHVDVGSRVDGFVAHVATFMPVEVIDIRPITTTAANIDFTQRDIMAPSEELAESTESLSCLHALEHFGLGRYGDPVDFLGYLRGWDNLSRMLKPGGRFYFSVPISRQPRIEFDAHRLFAVPHLLEMIDPTFDVDEACIVDDSGELQVGIDVRSSEASRSFDVSYGCIVFVLRKRA